MLQTISIGPVGSSGGHLREYDIQTTENVGGLPTPGIRGVTTTADHGIPGVAGGARATIINGGTAETYPTSIIHGLDRGGLIDPDRRPARSLAD
jgi:hypothetical protein